MRSLFVFLALSVFSAALAQPVSQKIDLLEVIKSGNVEHHVNPKMDFHDAPEDIWTFAADGTFTISGRGYGYVATKENYRDYHLVLEFKWGTKTWGAREKKAKDNGILLHAYGPHGAYSDTWMASIEAQIIEGGVGDILVLSPKLADGTELTTSVSAEIALDRDKEKIWKQGEPRQTVTKGRINWKWRDEDWADKIGFRGKNDVESPPGEWNRLEVIAKGDTLQYFVNGAFVNEAFDCKPSEGKILLQTEGAEMIVRRYELYPLGGFQEKWSAIQASGGSDVSVRDGQEKALSPEASMKRIQLDGPYEVQLVAAEPLVLDPVECTWDEKGRMFVADMRDYPLGPPKAGDPWLSRIQLLTDDDGDGRMDKAVTFADHLDNVQGLLPYNGGLIATTRSQILFLKDTNGDNVADEIKPLIKGFNPRHSQLQVSAPRWGLDGCVHFNNGLDAKEIYGVSDAGDGRSKMADGEKPISHLPASISVSGANFKWNPKTGEITPTGGKGQYGGAFDDYGHHFYCSNRNPLMFTVMPYEAMLRNPHAGITQNYEDIAPAGAETRVYPLQITHTTADAHAGTNTACSGLGVYRGPLMPELRNNVFVPDPTGQLVTRYKIEPNGASLKATRVGDRTEFFRSSDEWCRPVNFTTGPDGAIYICDIYRRWIDHARFFPEEFVKTHDMRQGENEGRIWRVVPKGKNARKIEPAPEKVEDLVAMLGHENAWQRETAQRLLIEEVINTPDSNPFALYISAAAKVAQTQLGALHLASLFNVQFMRMWSVAAPKTPTKTPEIDKTTEEALRAIMDAPALSSKGWPENAEVALYQRSQYIDHYGVWDAQKSVETKNGRITLAGLLCAANAHGGFGYPEATKASIQALNQFPGEVWIQRVVLSNCLEYSGTLLEQLIVSPWSSSGEAGAKSDFVRLIVASSVARLGDKFDYDATAVIDQRTKDLLRALNVLRVSVGQMTWWKPALLQGLAEGLPRSGGKLGVKSLAELIAKPPAQFAEAAKEISALMAQIKTTAKDPKAPLDTRLSVLPLLAQQKWDTVQPIVKELLTTTQPAELTTAALALLRKFSIKQTESFIYGILPHTSPSLRGQLVTLLAAGSPLELLKRMDRGELPKALIDVEKRWGLQRGKGELAELAKKLFGQPSADRAAVIASYMDCTTKLGDAEKGKAVFASVCIACHKVGDLGMEVGPPLSDVKVKPPEALLSDILDPNRMFEARWSAYQIDTQDGRSLSGLITAETSDAVVLTMMGGLKETIQRSSIKELKSLDRSLMPPGLEAGITKEQMSDLLAFLLGR